MKIKNAVGTADESCSCGSWLDHWKRFSQRTTRYCAVTTCHGTDIVGAHVQVIGFSATYICPLCKEHNKASGAMLIPDGYPLVNATTH